MTVFLFLCSALANQLDKTNFKFVDTQGTTPTNSPEYKGKVVVLEWFNPGCPFVKYAYEQGIMNKTSGSYVNDTSKSKESVVWLAVNSGAPGKQGAGLEASQKPEKSGR